MHIYGKITQMSFLSRKSSLNFQFFVHGLTSGTSSNQIRKLYGGGGIYFNRATVSILN